MEDERLAGEPREPCWLAAAAPTKSRPRLSRARPRTTIISKNSFEQLKNHSVQIHINLINDRHEPSCTTTTRLAASMLLAVSTIATLASLASSLPLNTLVENTGQEETLLDGGGGGGGGQLSLASDEDLMKLARDRANENLLDNQNVSTTTTGNSSTDERSTWSMLMAALFEYPTVASAPTSSSSTDIDYDGSLAHQPNISYTVNWSNLILALVLILLMLTTAIGNLFVIVAILIERNLRTIGNYLVLSLAIADLLVALLVMPLASIYLILEGWTLGVRLCDIWTSADVFCCTASILHLLAIALDRYWAVTRVDYIRCQRNEKRILFMIFCVWMAAGVISLAPVFGWKDKEYEERITNNKECLISQDIGYQIFATCTTFYFPLTLTLIFYWKIYQVARKRIRRKLDNRAKLQAPHPSSTSSCSTMPATSAGKTKQITRNQSIVKYSQKSGSTGKFTINLTGPAQAQQLLGTIRTTTNAATNRPLPALACQCLCHKSNQAQSVGLAKLCDPLEPDGTSPEVRMEADQEARARQLARSSANSECQPLQRVEAETATTAADSLVGKGDKEAPAQSCAGQDLVRLLDKNVNGSEGANGNGGVHAKLADNRRAELECDDVSDEDDCEDEEDGEDEDGAQIDPLMANGTGDQNGHNNATNENNVSHHSRARRQSNLNSTSSCSRCKRNQFQEEEEEEESQSNSMASCSRTSSFQANYLENQDELLANNKNGSSLSSTNCAHGGLILMETNSLDGDIGQTNRGGRRQVDEETREAGVVVGARQQHRKSLGLATTRRLSTACACCSCTVCCNDQSQVAGDLEQATTNHHIGRFMAEPMSIETTETRLAESRPVCEQVANESGRTIEVKLDKDGKLTYGLVESTSLKGVDMISRLEECDLDGGAARERQLGAGEGSSSCSWLTVTRRLVKRRLSPLEPTCNMIAICWRRLLAASSAKTKQEQAFESAEVLAVDQQSTSVLIVGQRHLAINSNHHHQESQLDEAEAEDDDESVQVAVCRECQCPLSFAKMSRLVDDTDRLDPPTGPANLAAAVASTTTIALSTSEGPNQQEASLLAGNNASNNHSTSIDNHPPPPPLPSQPDTPIQKARLFLMQQQQLMQSSPTVQSQAAQMEGVESKRERKAAKTLAIITGVFVMCWLPFFMMAIAMPLLQLKPHKYLFAFLLWLGYFNSMLNPIIYTIFSPDFRKAFKRLLCGSDEKAQRKKRRAGYCGRPIMSNGNKTTGLGTGPRSCALGNMATIGDRFCKLSPSLGRLLSCCCCVCQQQQQQQHEQVDPNSKQWNHQLDRDGSRFESPRTKTLNSNATTMTPNSSPRNIPGQQPVHSSTSSLIRPKSIITNHF